MRRHIKEIVSVFCLILPCLFLHAQMGEVEKDTSVYLPNDDVEVIKAFRARLANANRIDWRIDPLEVKDNSMEYDYSTSVRKLDIDYRAPMIRPITLYPEKEKKTYRGYIRGAYGYPNVWLGDLSYVKPIKDRVKFGIRYSGQGNHDDKNPLQNFQYNEGNVFGSVKISDKLRVRKGLDFHHDQRRFSSSISDSFLLQKMFQYGGNIRIEMPKEEQYAWSYYAESSFHHSALSLLKYKENEIHAVGGLFYTNNHFKIGVNNSSKMVRAESDTVNRALLSHSQFTFSYLHKRNKYKIGIDHLYSKSFGQKWLPSFDISLRLYQENLFVRFLGKNRSGVSSIRELFGINPYIAQFDNLYQGDFYIQEYEAQLYGKLGKLQYRMAGGYALFENAPIYWLKSVGQDTMAHVVQHINGNAPYLRFKLGYNLSETIEVSAEGEHYFLTSSNDLRFVEWLQSELKTTAKIYAFRKRFVLEPHFRLSRIVTHSFESKNRRVIPELGMNMSYQFSKYVSIFVHSHNLLNNQEARYAGHPIIGRSALLGLRCKW